MPRGASAGENLSYEVLNFVDVPIAKGSNDSGGKLRGDQRMLEQSIEFWCESGAYQCRESGQPGGGNQFPILQNGLLTELFQTDVVMWDGGGGQEFWRSLWVLTHGEAGVPDSEARGKLQAHSGLQEGIGLPLQQRQRDQVDFRGQSPE